jgi:hypothetical protein
MPVYRVAPDLCVHRGCDSHISQPWVGATRPVLVPKGRDYEVKELPTFAPVAMAGNSPHLAQDTVDRSIRILLMPDSDGLAEDSDWEALDGEVTTLCDRVSQWADSVRAHIKDVSGHLPDGCIGRLREKWRPLMRVAELADGAGGHYWKDMVDTMAKQDLDDMTAQREAGLRQQTPGLVLLSDLARIWPPGEYFVASEKLITLLVDHNPEYWGPGAYPGGDARQRLSCHSIQPDDQPGHQKHIETARRWWHTKRLRARTIQPGLEVHGASPVGQPGRSGCACVTGLASPRPLAGVGSTGLTDSTGLTE